MHDHERASIECHVRADALAKLSRSSIQALSTDCLYTCLQAHTHKRHKHLEHLPQAHTTHTHTTHTAKQQQLSKNKSEAMLGRARVVSRRGRGSCSKHASRAHCTRLQRARVRRPSDWRLSDSLACFLRLASCISLHASVRDVHCVRVPKPATCLAAL